MQRILIVEDEHIIAHELAKFLREEGYDIVLSDSIASAKQALDVDLALVNTKLRDGAGINLITYFKSKIIPTIMMSNYASVKEAVSALKNGAKDYLIKPFAFDDLIEAINDANTNPSTEENELIGTSDAMQQLNLMIQKVAPTSFTVLITGPSGTGKELIAKSIHQQSLFSQKPFVIVNCASLSGDLLESELFGHEKGAFTGAHQQHDGLVKAAEGGTLFLDEIGELSSRSQASLLRLLENKEYRPVGSSTTMSANVRIVAATHQNLWAMVKNGSFREDLMFRLNSFPISAPALKDRKDDIKALAEYFLNQLNLQYASQKTLPSASIKKLKAREWSGNVRELKNVIERAYILSDPESILPETIDDGPQAMKNAQSLDQHLIQFVLQNQELMTETEISEKLGISRKSLWEKRQRLGIPKPVA